VIPAICAAGFPPAPFMLCGDAIDLGNPEWPFAFGYWDPATMTYSVRLGIRPRKFYATRHTFISVAVSKGCNLKWVAEYCGTSVEMIEKSYGRYITDDGVDPLIRSLGEAKGKTLRQTFSPKTGTDEISLVIPRVAAVVPGGIEPQPSVPTLLSVKPRRTREVLVRQGLS